MKNTLILLCFLVISSCAARKEAPTLSKVSYNDLPGWSFDNHEEAFTTFSKSCDKIRSQPSSINKAGISPDWQYICSRIPDTKNARIFFESNFIPYAASFKNDTKPLFTGYFEIELKGSRTKQAPYLYPIYKTPKDLNYSRAEINAGALQGRNLEIVWVDDIVRLFFLHVQGSGRIKLSDGNTIRVGFSAKNNHDYVSIGKYMAEHGYIDKKTASKDSIEKWFSSHPDKIKEVLEKNPSYIFFREITGDGPIGAQGIPLTPGRSIAVDKNFIPYGAPVWVDTVLNGDGGKPNYLQKLFIPQDTGSAIKGPLRIDIFFGYGPKAEKLAGYQNSRGRYFILLPNSIK